MNIQELTDLDAALWQLTNEHGEHPQVRTQREAIRALRSTLRNIRRTLSAGKVNGR